MKKRKIDIVDTKQGWGVIDEKMERGSGLQNIKRRAEEVNGKLQMKSKPGDGTEITLLFPIIP